MGARRPLVRVNGRIAALPSGDTIDKTSVGLGNVDNTADANKPVSAAQQAALDLKVAKSNIVGIVSQASGVPTGAIIETGSNANGVYIKYADGTMECRRSGITLAVTANTTSSIVLTFPIAFVGATITLINLDNVNSSNEFNGYARAANSGTANFTLVNYWSVSQNYVYSYVTKGRWF